MDKKSLFTQQDLSFEATYYDNYAHIKRSTPNSTLSTLVQYGVTELPV